MEDDGIDGILSRLEKERGLSFAMGSREKPVYDKDSWRDAVHDPGDTSKFSSVGSNIRPISLLIMSNCLFFMSSV